MLGEARGGETGRRSTAAVRGRRARGGRCSGSKLQRRGGGDVVEGGDGVRHGEVAIGARWPRDRAEGGDGGARAVGRKGERERGREGRRGI